MVNFEFFMFKKKRNKTVILRHFLTIVKVTKMFFILIQYDRFEELIKSKFSKTPKKKF
jgi:hypothetical protein